MSELVLLKLGGSIITQKTEPNIPRLEVIKRLASEIKQAINEAGAEKETLLLSKLCFTLANERADLNILQAAIDTAKTDL